MAHLKLRRDRGRLPRSGLVVSGVIHAAVFALLLFGPNLRRPLPEFQTFKIELVATAPEPMPLPPVTEELVIETPDPTPPAPPEEIPPPDPRPDPEPDETPPPDPEPEPVDPEPEPEETPPTEVTPPTPPPEQPVEEEPEEETGSSVTARLEGLRRDFPEYYGNIVQQISNCFRPPPGNDRWEAVIYFEITDDGTVRGVRPVERSGSAAFNLAAIGAVADCASGRFGPLPDELPYEVLPVQFTFRPRGIGR
ncbi:MAG: TonB C-terminal domain-containing protein [Longimicrobiales bacterium]